MKSKLERYLDSLPFHEDGMETDLDTQCWLVLDHLFQEYGVDFGEDDELIANNIKYITLRYARLIVDDKQQRGK